MSQEQQAVEEQSPAAALSRERERLAALTLRTSALSVVVNLVLAVGKYGLGVLSGSLALHADALHSATDVVAAAAVLIGIKLSRRRSPEFPYGLYKLENLLALGAAGLIFLTAYELAREAVLALVAGEAPAPVHNIPMTLVGLGLLTLLTLAWVYYEQSVARRTNSPALEADAGHVFTDVLSLAALFAVLAGALFGLRLDAWATLLIVVLVALTGWRLAVAALRVLLDASVEREVLNAVEAALAEHPHVTKVEAVRGRNSGSYRFIEAIVQLDVHDFDEAEQISRELEERVRETAPFVDDFMLHCRPRQKTHEVYALPVEEDRLDVCEHFGEAPGFLLVRVRLPDKQVEDVAYLPNPYGEVEHGKGIQVAEMLISHGADVVLTPSSLEGRGSFYALREAHKQVHTTGARRTVEALAEHEVRLTREQIKEARVLAPDKSATDDAATQSAPGMPADTRHRPGQSEGTATRGDSSSSDLLQGPDKEAWQG